MCETTPPDRRRATRLVVAALCVIVMAACGQEVAVPGEESTEGVPAVPDDAGISHDEAQERGVAVAEYDALLVSVRTTPSGGIYELRNVGHADDVYSLTLEPADAGTVTPRHLQIGAGESATIHVDVGDPAEIVVTSGGRGGQAPAAEVVRQPVE